MLVIERKDSERVRVGKDIWIEILESKNGRTRIGFTAPKSTEICREELLNTNGILIDKVSEA